MHTYCQTEMLSETRLFLNTPSSSRSAADAFKPIDKPPTNDLRCLNQDTILQLAKTCLQATPCECEDCEVILNSWNTLKLVGYD